MKIHSAWIILLSLFYLEMGSAYTGYTESQTENNIRVYCRCRYPSNIANVPPEYFLTWVEGFGRTLQQAQQNAKTQCGPLMLDNDTVSLEQLECFNPIGVWEEVAH